MAGLRDMIIHHYFGIDYNIVWDTAINQLPILKEQIHQIMKEQVN
jgi:uncharacterized protein with HEPN domain